MNISKNEYYESKNLYMRIFDYTIKSDKKITSPTFARLHYEDVENNYNEESDIISEILFQNAVIEKIGTIPSAYIEGLVDMIKKVDNGYKFTVLNDEEYADLKAIAEKLKIYLAEYND